MRTHLACCPVIWEEPVYDVSVRRAIFFFFSRNVFRAVASNRYLDWLRFRRHCYCCGRARGKEATLVILYELRACVLFLFSFFDQFRYDRVRRQQKKLLAGAVSFFGLFRLQRNYIDQVLKTQRFDVWMDWCPPDRRERGILLCPENDCITL